MGASENRNKNSAMSAYLSKSGYPHGVRATSTLAPPVPKSGDVGSAAYRRRMAKVTG